jgi:hypothetical protein
VPFCQQMAHLQAPQEPAMKYPMIALLGLVFQVTSVGYIVVIIIQQVYILVLLEQLRMTPHLPQDPQ